MKILLLLALLPEFWAADDELQAALQSDDACQAEGSEGCGLSVLQLRKSSDPAHAARNDKGPSREAAQPSREAAQSPIYRRSWAAMGDTFFDDFVFMTVDETHGANQYIDMETAMFEGLISTGDSATIRVGDPGDLYKRKTVNIHSKFAWSPDHGFLTVMKYKHLPTGPGVWPGFWFMNSDVLWPQGGELDVLEYANDEDSKVSFHTSSSRCTLDEVKMERRMQGVANLSKAGSSSCETAYFANKFGCLPAQRLHNGAWYAKRPGVIATEWSPEHIKVFHIPEQEIPEDLHSDAPKPETWDKWLHAYLPFNSGCAQVAGQQEIVIDIAMCGDWAGGAWESSESARKTGFTKASGKCHVDIWDPANDCCTKFIAHDDRNELLAGLAYFEINYVKVFTPAAVMQQPLVSGTFKRGGALLPVPTVPTGPTAHATVAGAHPRVAGLR